MVSRDLDHMEVRPSCSRTDRRHRQGSALLAIRSFAPSTHTVTTAASADSTGAWRHFRRPTAGHIPTFGRLLGARPGPGPEGLEVTGPAHGHPPAGDTGADRSQGFSDGAPTSADRPRSTTGTCSAVDEHRSPRRIRVSRWRCGPSLLLLLIVGHLAWMDGWPPSWSPAPPAAPPSAWRTSWGPRPAAGGHQCVRDDHVARHDFVGVLRRVLSYRDVAPLPVGPTMVRRLQR